jgi:hypothetical protein
MKETKANVARIEPETETGAVKVEAVPVELALVTYRDESNRPVTQLAVIGKNTVHVLDGKPLGLAPRSQPARALSAQLRDAVFKALQEAK